jgi:hypothetical protein
MNSDESSQGPPKEAAAVAEPAECTLEELFLTVPPGGLRRIKTESLTWKALNPQTSRGSGAFAMPPNEPQRYSTPLPELKLDCSSERCGGISWFEPYVKYRNPAVLELPLGDSRNDFIEYRCKICEQTRKTYSVWFSLPVQERLLAYKFGEYPDYGPELPAKVLRLFQSDVELFKKGRKAELLNFGIAAFTYYRRIVENHKSELFDRIIKIAEEDPAFEPAKTEAWRAARNFTQFSKSVDAIKDAIPESLKMWGHNLLALLHKAFSEGVHDLSDEECLARAHTVRSVLIALAERMALIRAENAELKGAISVLIRPRK